MPAPRYAVLPRSLVALLAASVILNLLLAAAGVFVVIRQVQLSNRIHDAQVQSCRATNGARHQDIAIWNRLLNVPHPPRSALREIRDLERLVADKDHPVNCAALYHT